MEVLLVSYNKRANTVFWCKFLLVGLALPEQRLYGCF
jgi:hypothetical protein